ncbi:MAG TPA: thioredoxin domain-containing protein [Polyangiaceae bacterium]|nr:thioredoxin domain-containing protein [Polyangiaceae bacterium]
MTRRKLTATVLLGLALAAVGWQLVASPQASPLASGRAQPSAVPRPSTAPSSAAPTSGPDETVWKVPVTPNDPVRGAPDALVTLVAFSEFQCRSCREAAETLAALQRAYPTQLRIVWKDSPLPFHPRARPAAVLARVAEQQKGPGAFWKAHDLLMASSDHLEDSDLETIAKQLHLSWASVQAAFKSEPVLAKIDQGIELGGDVQARGTPHFFVNGRRLAGSQPIEDFRRLIDEELRKAQALVASGVSASGVYEKTIESAKDAAPLVKRDVPPPDAKSPFRGADSAPVTIQIWAEFPCAACVRIDQRLTDLETEYGDKLRIVWRHVPSQDPSSNLLAQVAQEVFEQGGSSAFWIFRGRVLDAQLREGQLDRSRLEQLATQTGIDAIKLSAALASGRHQSHIQRDRDLAAKADLTNGPIFTLGPYVAESDPSWARLKKLINRVLRPPHP